MAILHKPYEISVWEDRLSADGNSVIEQRVSTIGINNAQSQCYAIEPKLKRNVNGTNELTFRLHHKYKDNSTGEKVHNPLVDIIHNETKIKLKYEGKWYDFLVKNIQQNSTNSVYTYQATDLHINELSKNGYGLVLDTTLMNNSGTAAELAETILQDTDWDVQSEQLDQYLEESLAKLTKNGVEYLVPYSSLKNKPEYFQYFFSTATPDEDGIIRGKDNQTYEVVTEGNKYTTDDEALKYGFYYPTGWVFIGLVSTRGERLVYSQKSKFNPALNKIVYYYNNEQVAGYTTTDFITPNLIQNLITNNTFKTTSGWQGAYICAEGTNQNQGSQRNAKIEAKTNPDILNAIKGGLFDFDTSYTPYLDVSIIEAESCLVNSGFYDNRRTLGNVSAGQRFVLLYKETKNTAFSATIGEREYKVSDGHYITPTSTTAVNTLLTFNSSEAITYITSEETMEFEGYKYITATVNSNYDLNEREFQHSKMQLFLTGAKGANYNFYDFQLFPFIPDPEDANKPLLPTHQSLEATPVTKYFYYSVEDNPEEASAEGYKATAAEYSYLLTQDSPSSDYIPTYVTDKIRSINVKQSNYFNAIQSLCEAFECWAEFVIEHDNYGNTLSKTVVIQQYIGQDNHVGFRYGTNLSQTTRTIDSKAIVTKLIVPDNSNEHARNGFCSITRAGANPSGENYIFNFQYYVNKKMLNETKLNEILNNPITGYYPRLLVLNTALNEQIDGFANISGPLTQAQAQLTVAQNGKAAAEEKYQDAVASFLKLAGYNYTDIQHVYETDEEGNIIEITGEEAEKEIAERLERLEKDSTLMGYYATIGEQLTAFQQFSRDEISAQNTYDDYRTMSDAYTEQINTLNEQRAEINKDFFSKYYRFIQEGTWIGNEYTDDEKYYIDALNTSYNSCMPKVTYNFSVLDLSQFPEYEDFTFKLADKTWVEDVEFFGYAANGTPYREEVVITEIVYSLDEPDKNTITVRNHRNQFADLFQKQTATVQQVQFAQGAWEKAAGFTEATPSTQATFLQNALAQAELTLQNAGEQSVVWDKDGITVTDIDTPSQQIRIVGGAIMMRDEDKDGLGWKTGITSKGINAKLLTAGQLNTGAIQIMNGDEPYFRWDAYGITAYDFQTDPSQRTRYQYGLDTKKGVRFDRFGIYGYHGVDGSTWHPNSLQDVKDKSLFALTWDGLHLKLGHAMYDKYNYYDPIAKQMVAGTLPTPKWHSGGAKIGKTGEHIYNKWVTGDEAKEAKLHGLPYYDPEADPVQYPEFVKVFSVSTADDNEQLAIYDNGTLVANDIRLTGSIQWTQNSSPSKTVYGKITLTTPPEDGTAYLDIPETETGDGTAVNPYVWHRMVDEMDVVYSHTDDGGATWQGPFLITGRSIERTEVQYTIADRNKDPETITDWSYIFPTTLIDGKCVFTRMRDIYNNGAPSPWRYSVGYIGTSNYKIVLDNDYASISIKGEPEEVDVSAETGVADETIEVHEVANSNWHAIVNANVYYGDEIDTGRWVFSVIPSQRHSYGLVGSASGNQITIHVDARAQGRLGNEEHIVGIKATRVTDGMELFTSFVAAKLHPGERGEDGEDAIGYKVVGYPMSIVRHVNANNQFTPNDFTLNALKQIGLQQFTSCVGYWSYSLNDGNPIWLNSSPADFIKIKINDLFYGTGVSVKDLEKITINFYLSQEDTIPADKGIIVVAEDGLNGTSIEGVQELYYASETEEEDLPLVLITNDAGEQIINEEWKTQIGDTGYGPNLPFLWNTERIILSKDGGDNDFTEPAIIAHYGIDGIGEDGRGLKGVKVWYCANQDALTPPESQPYINPASPAEIVVPNGVWKTNVEDFELKAGSCLWEKEFFEFDKADEFGQIYIAKLPAIVRAIPRDEYFISLSNDSGAVVTDHYGEGGIFGDNTTTTVFVYNGINDDSDNWDIDATSNDLVYEKNGAEFHVSAFVSNETETGTLTITATHKENTELQLTTTFIVYKVKSGEPGAGSTSYWIDSSCSTIAIRSNGQYVNDEIIFTFVKRRSEEEIEGFSPGLAMITVDDTLYSELHDEGTSFTIRLGSGGVEPVKHISCAIYANEDDSYPVDTQTLEVIYDGADGKDGKDGVDGENSITLRTYAPNGNIILNEGNNVELSCILMDGYTNVTSRASYLWSILVNGVYQALNVSPYNQEYVGYNSSTLTVPSNAVHQYASYRVQVVYREKQYYDYITVQDKTDPVQTFIYSTLGDKITNGNGEGCIYARVYRGDEELDALQNLRVGKFQPNNPITNDIWAQIDPDGKQIILKKYNGSSWELHSLEWECSYEWCFIDQNGEKTTLNQQETISSKFIYIEGDYIQKKMQFELEVTELEE